MSACEVYSWCDADHSEEGEDDRDLWTHTRTRRFFWSGEPGSGYIEAYVRFSVVDGPATVQIRVNIDDDDWSVSGDEFEETATYAEEFAAGLRAMRPEVDEVNRDCFRERRWVEARRRWDARFARPSAS